MFDILLNHNTLVLFGIIFFGIALGSIKIYGLNLGLSGVLFVALAAGHYRLAIPNGVGQLGLALFVYCVGLSAGNRFFSAIAKQGSKLAVMSAVIVGVSALFTCLCGIWFNGAGGYFLRHLCGGLHQHSGACGRHGKPARGFRAAASALATASPIRSGS